MVMCPIWTSSIESVHFWICELMRFGGKQAWNLKMPTWKRKLLHTLSILVFHVSFREWHKPLDSVAKMVNSRRSHGDSGSLWHVTELHMEGKATLVNPNGPPWLAVEVIPWDVKPRTQDAIVTTRIIRILLGSYFTVFIWRLLGSISSNFTSRDQWWIPFHPKVENFWRTDVISKYLDKVSSPKKKWEDESTTGHGTFHLSTFQYLLSSISCNTIGFL